MKYLRACVIGLGIWGAAAPSAATHFMVGVDPATGAPTLFFYAGMVSGRNDAAGGAPAGGAGDTEFVSPSQSVHLGPETEAALIAQALAGSDVIDALLRSHAAMGEEQQLLAAFAASLSQSLGGPGEGGGRDEAGMREGMDELLAGVVGAALASMRISEEEARALIERLSGGHVSRPPVPQLPPSAGQGRSEIEDRQRELREQAEQRREQQREQLAEREREREQQNQALLAKLEEQRRQQQEANQRAAEERKRAAEEALKEKLSADQRRAYEERMAQREAEQKRLAQEREAEERERLRARLLAERGPAPQDPGEPATPDSFQDHVASVSGGSQPGDSGHGDGSAATPGQGLDDVQTDFANQQQRDESVGDAVAAVAWEDFLVNKDGPVTEVFPSESIYGQASGTYNGLVRGEFEHGVAANGTIQMNISFATQDAAGVVRFDDNQGTMQFEGWVGDVGFELSMEGNAFGGAASGYLYGHLYGANGEEVGGEWGMGVYDGDFADQYATGHFAAKQ